MDENEIPLTVINLPMVYYFKNNLKRAPVHYEKEYNNLYELLEFINEHAT